MGMVCLVGSRASCCEKSTILVFLICFWTEKLVEMLSFLLHRYTFIVTNIGCPKSQCVEELRIKVQGRLKISRLWSGSRGWGRLPAWRKTATLIICRWSITWGLGGHRRLGLAHKEHILDPKRFEWDVLDVLQDHIQRRYSWPLCPHKPWRFEVWVVFKLTLKLTLPFMFYTIPGKSRYWNTKIMVG